MASLVSYRKVVDWMMGMFRGSPVAGAVARVETVGVEFHKYTLPFGRTLRPAKSKNTSLCYFIWSGRSCQSFPTKPKSGSSGPGSSTAP